ncbi:MAG: hypothetical protein H6Q90_5863 [Deltaproteobacteria bacterium]|nr:hypothetical protein [Deltaproteobacteria bacterium]
MRPPVVSRPVRSALPALALSFCTLACAAEAIDGRDDAFIVDGKSDTGGIVENSAEAAAVLYLANTTSYADLTGELGLATKSADNIVAVRDGDDRTAETDDDARFTTLAQLDAVPFVGPIAFDKLLQYARDNDVVGDVPSSANDPFDPASCTGAPMSMADARSRWNHGAAELSTYQIAIRNRKCTNGSCSPWTTFPNPNLEWRADTTGIVKLGQFDGEMRLIAQSRLCHSYSRNADLIVGTVCDGVGESLHCSTYGQPSDCYREPGDPIIRAYDGSYIRFNGTLTAGCVQLISHSEVDDSLHSGVKSQTDVAILKRF